MAVRPTWLLYLSLVVILFYVFRVKAVCQDTDGDAPMIFATKTAYDAIRGTEAKEEIIPGCEAIQYYTLMRDGIRNDDTEDIQEAKATLESLRDRVVLAHDQGKGELCPEDLAALRTWTMRMKEDDSDRLMEAGRREVLEHAKRDKQRFPGLLDTVYSAADYLFRHTEIEGNRTRDTARAYAEGLLGAYDGIFMKEYSNEADRLLKFYATCDRYVNEVDVVDVEEEEKFLKGPEIQGVIKSVTRRLGLDEGTLDWDSVEAMFDVCGYDKAIFGDCIWSSAFSYEDLQIINYLEDIKYYWTDLYGHPINSEMPCHMIVDLVHQFESAIHTGKPLSVNHFGHSSTTNGMLAILGLFHDSEDLRHDNFDAEQSKLWNASLNSGFAAGIQMALYKCGDGEHRLKTFVNEKPVVLPECSSEVCLLKDVMESWKPIADSCNLDRICKWPVPQETPGNAAALYGLPLLTIFFLLCVTLWMKMI